MWRGHNDFSVKVPDVWMLDSFFKDRTESLRLFHHVRVYIERLGPVEVEVMKTQVSFGAGGNSRGSGSPRRG
jgi:hypothetical protein